MRTTRIHVDIELSTGQELLLPAAQSAHLLRVLRLRPAPLCLQRVEDLHVTPR